MLGLGVRVCVYMCVRVVCVYICSGCMCMCTECECIQGYHNRNLTSAQRHPSSIDHCPLLMSVLDSGKKSQAGKLRHNS